MRAFYLKLFTLILISSGLSFSASAQTYVDQNASGSNNGSSWGDAYTDLTVALDNTTSGEIWVAAGTYLPGQGSADSSSTFRVSNAISLYGGFAGTETSIDQRDLITNPTNLSGDINGDDVEDDFDINKTDNVQHVMVIDSLIASPVVVDGFKIIGGNTSDNNSLANYFWRGGGILTYSTVEINNCDFSGNFARSGASVSVLSDAGGGNNSTFSNSTFSHNNTSSQSAGIFLENISDVSINDCEFTNNQTARGALYPLRSSNISVNNCLFEDNRLVDNTGFGGAFFNWNTTGLVFTDCSFIDNQGGNGGVFYSDGRENVPNNQDLVFQNCDFSDNTALDFGGGTGYVWRSSFTMDNCTFENNSGVNGSHIFMTGDDKDIVIQNSTFTGGLATFGGAHTCYGGNSTYLLENNSYSMNSASNNGGALIIGFLADVTINNCSFNENSADLGGAVSIQNDTTQVQFNDCTFESNLCSGSGAAVQSNGGIISSFDNCEFILNNSSDFGGAISISGNDDPAIESRVDIDNSTFNFNTATTQGGAINLFNTDANLTSNLIVNNTVPEDGNSGGAISINVGDSVTMEVNAINNTLAFNSAPIGGGISQFTGLNESIVNLTIQNNMFFNIGNNYEIEDGTPTVVSNGGNISSDLTIETAAGSVAEDQHEITDPMFANAGSFNFKLTAGSAAVNAGVATNAPLTDIEGNPRIDEVDSGAYEFDPSTGITPILLDNSALAILPNPVKRNLRFELTNEYYGKVNFRIYSSTGQLINNWTINKSNPILKESISVKRLTTGSYRLYALYNNGIITQQFIKL